MKIVCAGFPKTGSKSASSALRELGYNVADFKETLLYLSPVWLAYMDGLIPIENVIAEYKRHGFDVNQDFPGNMLWEDLFRALPEDTKVILTVRDNTEKWWESWCNFMKQEYTRDAIGDFCVASMGDILVEKGFMGLEMYRLGRILDMCADRYLSHDMNLKSLSVKQQLHFLTREERRLKQVYEKHNAFVKHVVPSDRLLIWNIKDGWERDNKFILLLELVLQAPLCEFLKKPVPDKPIPHDNKTGDKKWAEDYLFSTSVFDNAKNYFIEYTLKGLLKYGCCGFMFSELVKWCSSTNQHSKRQYNKIDPVTNQNG